MLKFISSVSLTYFRVQAILTHKKGCLTEVKQPYKHTVMQTKLAYFKLTTLAQSIFNRLTHMNEHIAWLF